MTDRPTWILLPGFSQTPSIWTAVADRLDAATMAAIPPGCDFETAADRLAEQHGRGSWAGYSMGGRLALRVALEYPDLVDRLVLVSATAGIRDPVERANRRDRDDELATAIERHGVDRFLDDWVLNPLFSGADPSALRHHRMTSAPAVADQLRRLGQGSQLPVWDRLGELRCPVMIVAGALDHSYAARAVELGAAIPQSKVEILAGAGHALLVERPAELAALLRGRT